MKYIRTVVTLCLTATLACVLYYFVTSQLNTARANEPYVDKQVKEIDGYKNWAKVNPFPRFLPRPLSNACTIWLPDTPTDVQLDGSANLHRNKYITVFVNSVGQDAMLHQKKPHFPVGSVIVKEKLPNKYSQTPELLTVMIKQKKGFNPANGDWEYMVTDGSGTTVDGRGQLKNCQGCHLGNTKTDYVFRTYLPSEVEEALK